MKVRPLVLDPLFALALAIGTGPAAAEDLLQIYREAQRNDPAIASARASWAATQEKLPQARAGLLPNATLTGTAGLTNFGTTIKADPKVEVNRNFANLLGTISASQPLYRRQSVVAVAQAAEQVVQADFSLGASQQDLILRVAIAYFDVLLAEYTIELTVSQKAAVSEQLAQAKRNFEVGVATITDTNEAQAKYDTIVAQEITTKNDYDNKVTALRAIIGRFPRDLRKIGDSLEPRLPEPNQLEFWVDKAIRENFSVRFAQANFDIATLEVERAKAAYLPTLDLVGSFTPQASSASSSVNASSTSRVATVSLQLSVPLYTGGLISSRVREAVALQERARQDLETARRNALFLAQTGFTGVTSAVASIKAFEQALVSAGVAYQSNKLGQEVGVRTNLDVLTVQQNLFSTRRDLAQAYVNYLIGKLRLKAADGELTEQDVEEINRQLKG